MACAPGVAADSLAATPERLSGTPDGRALYPPLVTATLAP